MLPMLCIIIMQSNSAKPSIASQSCCHLPLHRGQCRQLTQRATLQSSAPHRSRSSMIVLSWPPGLLLMTYSLRPFEHPVGYAMIAGTLHLTQHLGCPQRSTVSCCVQGLGWVGRLWTSGWQPCAACGACFPACTWRATAAASCTPSSGACPSCRGRNRAPLGPALSSGWSGRLRPHYTSSPSECVQPCCSATGQQRRASACSSTAVAVLHHLCFLPATEAASRVSLDRLFWSQTANFEI